jgi:hypothetical protein
MNVAAPLSVFKMANQDQMTGDEPCDNGWRATTDGDENETREGCFWKTC